MFRKICLLIVCVSLVPVALIAASHASKDLKPQISSPVVYVRERSFADLKKFGAQARAYTLMLGDKRIVIGVDFIRNQSGISAELPSDLSDYVINAIGNISPQFGAYRKWGGIVEIPGGPLAQPQRDPDVDFWIFGSLERASQVSKDDSKKGVDGEGGGGATQWDAHVGRNRTLTIKSLTVTFTLVGRDKVSIPGASATYRIDVGEQQREKAFSVYVAGSGISLDSTVTITQNLDDAIFDATAASVIHLLGNALEVPYYSTSSVFQPDEELDGRVHDSLTRLTRQDLEHNIKVWMFVDGYPMAADDLSGLTDHDRAIAEVVMFNQKLPFSNDGWVEFAFSLWKKLDYATGAKRVQDALAELAQAKAMALAKQQQEAASRQAAAEAAAKQQKQAAEENKAVSVQKPISNRRRASVRCQPGTCVASGARQ